MKPVTFLGDTQQVIKDWEDGVKKQIGYELRRLQEGLNPTNYKPFPSAGKGVSEIRIKVDSIYRVFYITKMKDAIYVLNAFQKKTQKTPQQEIEKAKQRLKLI